MSWTTLKAAIDAIITTNGANEITGVLMNQVLDSIVDNVGENATFVGLASPTTIPGTPDGPIFYLASQAGVYPNFGGLEVLEGEAALLLWNSSYWSKNSFLSSDIEYGSLNNNVEKDTYTSLADTGVNNILMPRLCKNPVSGKLIQMYRVSSSHISGTDGTFWMRVSSDGGLTWTGTDGTGTSTQVISEAGVSLRNNGTFYTPTGRLVVIYLRRQSGSYIETEYTYSDDDGLTWSTPAVFAKPAAGSGEYVSVYSNECVLDASGNLLIPFYQNYLLANGARIYLAKSTDNGVTWTTDYKLILNTDSEGWRCGEPVIRDFGNGHLVIIARSVDLNSNGVDNPLIMYSSDYGENWAGTSETLSYADLLAGNHNSGFLYLQGAGITMGLGDPTTNCLPDLLIKDFMDSKWMIIPYWIRDDGVVTYIEKITLINFYDYLENGVDAVVSTVVQTLFDGIKPTDNGGNGSGIIIGNDILYATVEQTEVFSGGVTNLYTLPLRSNLILNMIHAYYN